MDSDDAQLASLGYESKFKRDMSPWANFSLGFTYLSPVVGVYSLFAYALGTGGPPMIWSFVIVGVGQLLVALVFSEVVAQYPVAGGVYPWARRLWGRRWAWMTGWVYLIALMCTIASVAYGAGPYLAATFGFTPTVNTTIACSLAILALATAINFCGTRVLATAAVIGFSAEIIGALAVGGWLLLSHRHHGLGVLFDTFGTGDASGYLPAFAAAGLIGIWLRRFDTRRAVPPYALALAALVPALVVLGSKISADALTKIISFSSVGIYLAFQMVVLAALRARLKGWRPSGKYRLGAWGLPVNVAALAYGVTAIVNMSWPRTPDAPWYDNWIVPLSAVVVIGLGLVYMAVHRSYGQSDAPYDDAVPHGPARVTAGDAPVPPPR